MSKSWQDYCEVLFSISDKTIRITHGNIPSGVMHPKSETRR